MDQSRKSKVLAPEVFKVAAEREITSPVIHVAERQNLMMRMILEYFF